jgi:hypothetical protein
MKKNSTKVALVILAAIVLVSALAVLTPRAVRATTVALAEVVQNVDSPARNAWTGACTLTQFVPTAASCDISVPSPYEVVIQSVSIGVSAAPANSTLQLTLTSNSPPLASPTTPFISWYSGAISSLPAAGPAGPGGPGAGPAAPNATQSFVTSLPLTSYANSNGISVYVGTPNPNPAATPLSGTVQLVGYAVNIANPVAAIP